VSNSNKRSDETALRVALLVGPGAASLANAGICGAEQVANTIKQLIALAIFLWHLLFGIVCSL
jgi:hypothetical protein